MLINSSETHRVYLTGGGGPYLFISIPMIVMACYLSYLAVSSWFRNTEPFSTVIIFLVVGSVFMLVGLLLTLFREGITQDRIRGTASWWRKLFRRKTVAVHNLNEFSSVELYIHQSAKRTGYIVQLTGESKKILLCDLLKLQAAKLAANDVSAFLSLPIDNKTAN